MRQRFFNKAFALFKTRRWQGGGLIVGLSGGLDSVVLLDLLRDLSRPCRLKLCVAHIHHGSSIKKPIQDYRDRAEAFARALAGEYGLDFVCPARPKKLLNSEQDLRDFRHARFRQILKQKKATALALAHNRDDLLETRLIQLVRGCGRQALKAMPSWRPPLVRPLVFWTRGEIHEYARRKKLKWLEDPSNKDTAFLRNWIRKRWLPDLENQRPGAVKSLSRSLELLAEGDSEGEPREDKALLAVTAQAVRRDLLAEMPFADQKRAVAFYMRQVGISNFGQSHIEEILKLAGRREKTFSVRMLKRTWRFSLGGISVLPLPNRS